MRLGLLGHKISYSLSPRIFQAIFDLTAVDGSFELIDIPPEGLDTRWDDIRRGGFRGLAVTIPFKTTILAYLTEIATDASRLGAANCIAFRDIYAVGHNTDHWAFGYPLARYRQQLKGAEALVLGYGGAARAVCDSLAGDFRIGRLVISGRDLDRAEALARITKTHHPSIECGTAPVEALRNHGAVGIIVNCTSLGGWHHKDESPFPEGWNWTGGSIYYDLNYNEGNRLVAEASAAGAVVIDGRPMLVAQAARSFEIWSGIAVDINRVHEAVFGVRP